MAFIIQSLPFEIIELISTHTCTNDLLNAILVSKAWYHSFHAFIYRSLALDNHDKQQTILSAFHSDKLPGYLVRSITLQKIQLSEHQVYSLTKLFPDIDTLTIDWNIWGPLPFHAYFDPEAPISFIHPSQGLAPSIHHLFHHYGSHNLKYLSIDCLNHEAVDVWSILALCPRLKSLKLKNLNHEHVVTLGYLETIHQLCPQLNSLIIKCTLADPSPSFLPQFNELKNTAIVLTQTPLKVFSLSSKSGAAKWPYWLPYFSIKYPHLQHLRFKHCGLGKDGGQSQPVPDRIYTLFTHGCQHLKSVRWNKIIVQHDQQKRLFRLCNQHHGHQQKQPFLYLQSIGAYENFVTPGSLVDSPIVQQGSLMSSLLTSLTLGRPPTNISTVQVLKAIGQCLNLNHLKIQECFVDPDLAYGMDDILTYCKHLKSLYIKDVHVNCTFSTMTTVQQPQTPHPLRRLILKRSSFTEGVFATVSNRCAHLDHVELLACFQTDRRDQVRIVLPKQHLSILKIQGLRTRSFYTGCRIRFFVVGDIWYYMSQYDIRNHPVGQKLSFQKFRNMEYARRFDRLNDRDIQELDSLVTTKTLKAWDIEAAKRNLRSPRILGIDESCWDPENIYYSGIVKIDCGSIQSLTINNKLVVIN
jgi:hypothetical protein